MTSIAYTLIAILKNDNDVDIVEFNYETIEEAETVEDRIHTYFEDSSTIIVSVLILNTIVESKTIIKKEHTEISGQLLF